MSTEETLWRQLSPSPDDPWWRGRCRDIANETNFMANHPNIDLTPFQVECVMMTVEGINKREGRVTVPHKMVYLTIPIPRFLRRRAHA